MSIWADKQTWQEGWIADHDLGGGGQASTKAVVQRDDINRKLRFLKVLNRQSDPERRARFFREATAYSTAKHVGIPRLIESNAHNHENSSYKPYLVIEYIDGETLSSKLDREGSLDFLQAKQICCTLLEILNYCHAREWVHRDIKPDNILITKRAQPYLLDFGLAYSKDEANDFRTEINQELGNRFLRLPELSAFSTAKNDKRSDVALVGGVLFYSITGIKPSVLLNEHGQMPHQTLAAAAKIREVFPNRTSMLLGFFDKAFAQRLSDRYSSADEMMLTLEETAAMKDTPEEEVLTLEQIAATLGARSNKELARNKQLYDLVMSRVRATHSRILNGVQPTYVSFQTGYINFTQGLKNTLGFAHFGTQDHRFAPTFLVRIVGDELVLTADGEIIYRTSATDPIFNPELDKKVEQIFLTGLKTLIESQIA